MILKIMKLHKSAVMPKYATPGAVGFDLHALADATFAPGGTGMVITGIAIELSEGFEMTVRQRSGISKAYPNYIGIGIGTIDTDYRGEIMIPVVNNNEFHNLNIKAGDRVAQGIVSPIIQCEIKEVEELTETKRGKGGFGHTGI